MTDGNVYLDMDPGIDDALALAVALGKIHQVQGLMTVAGNVSGDKTYLNGYRLLTVMKRLDLPLVAGAASPLFYPLSTAEDVHGLSGLEGYDFGTVNPDRAPGAPPAWQWLSERLAKPGPHHVIATAPLTNLARLILGFPNAWQRLESLTIMGGSLIGGNITPTAEFNFFVDPDAAEVVLRAARTVAIVGLDVTHRARLPLHHLDRLRQFGRVGAMLGQLLAKYGTQEHRREGLAVHDAVAVAAFDRPELFEWREMPMAVVRQGELRGTLVALPEPERTPVRYAVDIDPEGFLDWLWQGLEPWGDV